MTTKRWRRFHRWWRHNRRAVLTGAGSILDLDGRATYYRMKKLLDEETKRR